MAFQTGRSGYFSWNNGSERDLSAYITECSLEREVDEIETTVFTLSDQTFLVGLRAASVSLSGFFDPTATTGPDAVLAPDVGQATLRAWIYGPYGSTGGNVKYSGSGFITSYIVREAVDGAVEYECEIRISGAVTRGTF